MSLYIGFPKSHLLKFSEWLFYDKNKFQTKISLFLILNRHFKELGAIYIVTQNCLLAFKKRIRAVSHINSK